MRRFRFTLLAICLLLFWLGYNDLSLQLRNPSPEVLTLEQLLSQGATREWVTIEGGYQNLMEAISTTGTLELDALLVPLKRDPQQQKIDLVVETRDPELLSLFTEYHFHLDSEADKERFRSQHADRFTRPRTVTGMIIGGLIADNNRNKLEDLAKEVGLDIRPGMIFIAEGKEPVSVRGYFYLGAAILGLLKFISLLRRKTSLPLQQKAPNH